MIAVLTVVCTCETFFGEHFGWASACIFPNEIFPNESLGSLVPLQRVAQCHTYLASTIFECNGRIEQVRCNSNRASLKFSLPTWRVRRLHSSTEWLAVELIIFRVPFPVFVHPARGYSEVPVFRLCKQEQCQRQGSWRAVWPVPGTHYQFSGSQRPIRLILVQLLMLNNGLTLGGGRTTDEQ